MMVKFVLALAGFIVATASIEQTVPQPTIAPPSVEPENILNLDLSTGGRVAIQLRPDKAPNHVERIETLTRPHFYDGLLFHRVIEGFMAQTGNPKGTGEGGSTLPDMQADFTNLPHVLDTLVVDRAHGRAS